MHLERLHVVIRDSLQKHDMGMHSQGKGAGPLTLPWHS